MSGPSLSLRLSIAAGLIVLAGAGVWYAARPAPLHSYARVAPATLARPQALYKAPSVADIAAVLATLDVKTDGAVARLYAAANNAALWTGPEARAALVQLAATASAQGLNGETLAAFDETPILPPDAAAARDVAISRAVLSLAAELHSGIGKGYGADWMIAEAPYDPAPDLSRALHDHRLAAFFADLPPHHAAYKRLVDALARYRAIADTGGWPELPKSAARDDSLTHRLAIEGYDGPLHDALARFQMHHGLAATGQLNADTVRALNVPASARIAELGVNLDRWRHLPRTFGDPAIVVNIAAATATMQRAGKTVFETLAIVGDLHHPTPVLDASIGAVTFNPHWDIPKSIATEDILPLLQTDPNYLAEAHMILTDGPAKDTPGSYIDWAQFTPDTFPMHIRQLPGDDNALGAIKFEMPNPQDIYLHDTPAHGLFARAQRYFSHGCVRLEQPEALAHLLLGNFSPPGTETRTISLPSPIPVYLLYFTAAANDDGTVSFFNDAYRRDPAIAGALGLGSPPPPFPPEPLGDAALAP